MVQIRKFNWVSRPTRYESAQAWSSHRRQMTQQFLSEAEAAITAFTTAQGSAIDGMATLAVQASIVRAQQQIAAAKASATSTVSSLDVQV